jgi:predicted Zn-dependent protease
MSVLSRDEAQALLEKALSHVTADHASASVSGSSRGNIRYARNTVTTSGQEDNVSLSVTCTFGKRSGSSSTNDLSDDAIQRAVVRAEELARLAPENPEFMPPVGPQRYLETPSLAPFTATLDASYRAGVARAGIEASKQADVTAAGFLEHSTGFSALMNSAGLFGYNQGTGVDFSLTVRTPDGTGSGYVERDVNDAMRFDPIESSQIAVDKAIASQTPRALEPGRYTVILEPSASVGLLQTMFWNMNLRAAEEGRTYFSRPGGETRIGEQFLDERISLSADPQDQDIPAGPWGEDGLALAPVSWIENGVLKNLAISRYWADQKGVAPLLNPGRMRMAGTEKSLAQLIAETERGILVTRTWYIRAVDPQTLLYTGLTRDGTFYVENGQVKYPVKNFRFNESPIIMLNNLDDLGKPMRMNGHMIPPMRIRDFSFTSLSDAI